MTLRAHSDTPDPLAAFSIALNSDGVTLARTMQLLASPSGSFGRPIFDFFMELLSVAQKYIDSISFSWHK
jgi:hypothetical protein